MSRLVPFHQCIARPDDEEGTVYLLSSHLDNVGSEMEDWSDDPHIRMLLQLAGLCHDVTKAHTEWQRYIRKEKKKGPSHAPSSAFLFSYIAYQYLQGIGVWERYRREWLWLVRDIADHHGNLDSLQEYDWVKEYEWKKIDLKGCAQFLHKYVPFVELSMEQLSDWMWKVEELIEEVLDELDTSYKEVNDNQMMMELQRWRHYTTALIASDRLGVKSVLPGAFSTKDCEKSIFHLQRYCTEKSIHPMAMIRQRAKEEIIEKWRNNRSARFYSLEMPTGYGKTIASLHLALEMINEYNYRKIIYVAPYLSIIEQTAKTIKEAIQQEVLQHHSLSFIMEDEERVLQHSLGIETWSHKIVCTSFQQFARAIFPKRAQHVLRRTFLEKSIIIVDEPQIFQSEGWNVFLTGLEAVACLYDLRVIFLSATMPPFQYGLSSTPILLSSALTERQQRYIVKRTEKMDEHEAAVFLSACSSSCKAMILNTIEDAYRVYKAVKPIDSNAYLVHGLMIPLHKQSVIQQIKSRLADKLPITVVSTQILEAGVDVSFETVIRANAILPSLIQAAGRVNRHLENNQQGTLWILPFYRGGQKDTRQPIYSRFLTGLTDELTAKQETWLESEFQSLIVLYYEKMFSHNTYEAEKIMIQEAYEGQWNKLSQYEPFGHDYVKLPLFINWNWSTYVDYLPSYITKLMQKYDVGSPIDIYEKFQDKQWMNQLSFEERKRFISLVYSFVINVPVSYALKVANKEDFLQKRIPLLEDTDAYDQQLGLIFAFEDQFDTII